MRIQSLSGFSLFQADGDTRPQGLVRRLIRSIRTLLVGPYFGPSEIFAFARKR